MYILIFYFIFKIYIKRDKIEKYINLKKITIKK